MRIFSTLFLPFTHLLWILFPHQIRAVYAIWIARLRFETRIIASWNSEAELSIGLPPRYKEIL